jgi:hypothetical protein
MCAYGFDMGRLHYKTKTKKQEGKLKSEIAGDRGTGGQAKSESLLA